MTEPDQPGSARRGYDWSKLTLELIVVFLGITAGFFVNDWQLERQELRLQAEYLSGILTDVNTNIAELEKAVADDSQWLDRVKPGLLAARDGTLSPEVANYSVIHGQLKDPAVIGSLQFENALAGYFSLVQQRKAAYEKTLVTASALRDTLRQRQ